MLRTLTVALLCLSGEALAGEPNAPVVKPVYVVSWSTDPSTNPPPQALVDQADVELRKALASKGVVVVTQPGKGDAIVLKTRLEVRPESIEVHVMQVRHSDLSVLGNVNARATGIGDKKAKIRALMGRAADESIRL